MNASRPTVNATASKTTVPNAVGKKPAAAEAEATAASLSPVLIGTGKSVLNQSLPAGQKAEAGQRLILNTGGRLKLPNLKGWTKAEVAALSQLTGLQVQYHGQGRVKKQSLPAGQIISSGQQIKLDLEE